MQITSETHGLPSPHLTDINATKKRSVCPPNPSTPHVEATGFFSSLPFQFQDAPFIFLQTLASPISSPSKTQDPDLCPQFLLKPIHACMDWSAMIPELLKHITDKLPHRFDYMNFRLVCKSWLSVAPPKNFPPILILPSHPNSGELHYIDPGAGGVHSLALPEVARKKIICGASQGWLALLDEPTKSMSLVNPITGAQFHLPPVPQRLVFYNFHHRVEGSCRDDCPCDDSAN